MIFKIRHQKHKQQKQESTNGTTLNFKASAQQKKQLKMKRQLVQEKMFANHISDKGLLSKKYKELTAQNQKKEPSDLKMGRRNKDIFP